MKNLCCGYSLEWTWRDESNEYPQHMFLWRNKQRYLLIITKYPRYQFVPLHDNNWLNHKFILIPRLGWCSGRTMEKFLVSSGLIWTAHQRPWSYLKILNGPMESPLITKVKVLPLLWGHLCLTLHEKRCHARSKYLIYCSARLKIVSIFSIQNSD